MAQGDRVLAIGVAVGKIKATNKAFKDEWVFDITIQNGKLTNIREYIDTQALARASKTDVDPDTDTSLAVFVSAASPTYSLGHDNYREVGLSEVIAIREAGVFGNCPCEYANLS